MPEAMQPSPLADSDITSLKEFFIKIAIEFLLYGIYSALVMIVLYKLWTNKAKLAAYRILIAAAISMFVASTAQISMDLAFILIQLPAAGFDPPNVERPLIYMSIFIDSMTRLNYLIGDSIVVWRAWILWTNHSKVHMLLCICLFGTFVGVTVDLAFVILFDSSQFSDSPRFSSLLTRSLILLLPLFWTNLISTLLIAYKVWEYKVEIKKNLGLSKNGRTKVERVLILLTESGSIYCFLWLSILVLSSKTSYHESFSFALMGVIISELVAEKANLESTVTGPSFSQSIQFASRPQMSTETHSDVLPGSTTSQIASVRPDPNRDDVSDSVTVLLVSETLIASEGCPVYWRRQAYFDYP
ncbi:hypothetical protein C8J56DRAFT_1024311 [Mycena floridula]|nr:hypothetical protein C8J56DRAFT_1024311 [Mycena floridula]